VNPFNAAEGTIEVSLERDEQLLLSQLVTLLGSVGAAPNDPAADRLNPDAFLDDVEASREFRRLTADELATARDMDRDVFERTLAGKHLNVDEAEAWVRILGDARLALAARRGVVDGEWEDEIETSRDLAVVAYLGFLQGSLVQALVELEAAA